MQTANLYIGDIRTPQALMSVSFMMRYMKRGLSFWTATLAGEAESCHTAKAARHVRRVEDSATGDGCIDE